MILPVTVAALALFAVCSTAALTWGALRASEWLRAKGARR